MRRNPDIALIMATLLEAEPLLSALSLSPVEEKPFRVYEGGGIRLILSGIGKARAAMASEYLVLRYGAKFLFNLGAAGSVGGDRRLGEVFHVSRVLERDRPFLEGRKDRYLEPDHLEGHRPAVLSTADIPVVTPEERAALEGRAELLDMEGAAVVQAARIFGAAVYLFKVVSDTPDHPSDEDIVRNILEVRHNLCDYFLNRVLERL